MKKFLFLILFLLIAIPVYANPFIVCDPQTGITHYKISGDTFWTAPVTSQTDGSLRTDLFGIPSGSHSIGVVACITDATWGEVCSNSSPFTFAKPGTPSVPANVRLLNSTSQSSSKTIK